MITITLNGDDFEVPSSAVDTNWAASQVAYEQALATEINALVAAVAALDAVTSSTSWFAETPINSWANIVSAQALSGSQDSLGWVSLRGDIHGGASGTTACSFASTTAPLTDMYFVCPAGSAGLSLALLKVGADGDCVVTAIGTDHVTDGVYISNVRWNITATPP